MAQCGYVTAGEAEEAVREVPQVQPRSDDLATSSYAVDYIRKVMTDRFGYEATFNGGLRVYTSLDSRMQAAAEEAINTQLSRLDKQRAKSSRLAPSVLPEQLQGALLSMNASTGEIYALVGGRSYNESKFDRAIDARRQPGSAFKPIVYAAAVEAGMTPATLIDAQESIFGTPQGPYLPANDGEQEFGRMTLRHALRNSVNTAAVQVGQVVGLRNVIRCAHDFGISGNLPEVLSLPLGAGEVTLLDLVRAYTAFPNGGRTTLPHIIMRVESATGKTVFSARPQHRTAIDEQTAFLMTSMLSDVVDHGTAYGVRAAGWNGPVAGKTGTTNDFRDAWFVGFTPDVVTGVWVGYDTPEPISNRGYGATVALPVWIRFMKAAFPKPLSSSFARPSGIVQKEVCAASGQLATAYCRGQWRPSSDQSAPDAGPDADPAPSTYTEYFSGRNLPPSCQLHSSLTSITKYNAGSEITVSSGSSP
jgi:penicillin-binding protein 1A